MYSHAVLGTSAAAESAAASGLTACEQDLIHASVAGTFVVSRDIKHAPLRLRQDMPVPFHYRKHCLNSYAFVAG